MGLRKVRSEATSLRKEGVSLNGSEKVMIVRKGILHKCVWFIPVLNGVTPRRGSLKKRLFLVL